MGSRNDSQGAPFAPSVRPPLLKASLFPRPFKASGKVFAWEWAAYYSVFFTTPSSLLNRGNDQLWHTAVWLEVKKNRNKKEHEQRLQSWAFASGCGTSLLLADTANFPGLTRQGMSHEQTSMFRISLAKARKSGVFRVSKIHCCMLFPEFLRGFCCLTVKLNLKNDILNNLRTTFGNIQGLPYMLLKLGATGRGYISPLKKPRINHLSITAK